MTGFGVGGLFFPKGFIIQELLFYMVITAKAGILIFWRAIEVLDKKIVQNDLMNQPTILVIIGCCYILVLVDWFWACIGCLDVSLGDFDENWLMAGIRLSWHCSSVSGHTLRLVCSFLRLGTGTTQFSPDLAEYRESSQTIDSQIASL